MNATGCTESTVRALQVWHATAVMMCLCIALSLAACGPAAGTNDNQTSDGIRIVTRTLPAASVGVAYAAELQAGGGDGSYTFSLASGTLPGGLALNAGVAGKWCIEGTPLTAGTFSFSLYVGDSTGVGSTGSLSLDVAAASAVTILTAALPDATAGDVYGPIQLEASGAAAGAALTWGISQGALPVGMSLSASGALAGTPDALSTGSYTLTVNVSDSGGASDTQDLTLAVVPDGLLTISGFDSFTVFEGDTLMGAFWLLQGAGPYVYGLSGAPAWVTLQASPAPLDHVLNLGGAAPAGSIGSYSFTIVAGDSSTPAHSAVKQVSLYVIPAQQGTLKIVTTSLPDAQTGVAYQEAAVASGGYAMGVPYVWTVISGLMPQGLTFSSAGYVNGTAAAGTDGTYLVEVQVNDQGGNSVRANISLNVVAGPLAIGISLPVPDAMAGMPYSVPLQAIGGSAPYTWQVMRSTGVAIPFLSIDASVPALLGAPQNGDVGTHEVKVLLRDAAQSIKVVSFSLIVLDNPGIGITTTSLPNAYANEVYAVRLKALGGASGYQWAIVSGALPAGLSLDATTGLIFGTATSGSSAQNLVVEVTDAAGDTDSQSLTFQVDDLAPGTLFTVAGTGPNYRDFKGDGLPALESDLRSITGAAYDPAGNLYMSDCHGRRIMKVDASTGLLSTIAGDGSGASDGDGGPAIDAKVDLPFALTADSAGNLYFVEHFSAKVRRISTSGIIDTIAMYAPWWSLPSDMALSPSEDKLFVSAPGDQVVYVIDLATSASAIYAGKFNDGGYTGDGGPATSARLDRPMGLCVANGKLIIADTWNIAVRHVDLSTNVITSWWNPALGGVADVVSDGSTGYYVAFFGNEQIVHMDAQANQLEVIAGNGVKGYAAGAHIATQADMNIHAPGFTMTLMGNGDLLIAEYFNGVVRKIRMH